MSKRFESFSDAMSNMDKLQVGEVISINGKPASIVMYNGRKIVRFTSPRVPQPKWQPAAMRRAQG